MNWPKAAAKLSLSYAILYAILGVYRLRLMNLSCVVIRRREKLVHIVVGYHDNFGFIARENIISYFCCVHRGRSSSGFFALRGNVSFAKDSSKGVIRKPHAVPLQP